MKNFLAAARAADRAAEAAGTPAELDELMKVLRYKEEMQIALTNKTLVRTATGSPRQRERRPLRDEGDDFGVVEASIPKNLFFGLMHQKNFGLAGFTSDAGMKDFARAFPQFMCKTASGKVQVGYGSKRAPGRRGVNFSGANFNGMKFAEYGRLTRTA